MVKHLFLLYQGSVILLIFIPNNFPSNLCVLYSLSLWRGGLQCLSDPKLSYNRLRTTGSSNSIPSYKKMFVYYYLFLSIRTLLPELIKWWYHFMYQFNQTKFKLLQYVLTVFWTLKTMCVLSRHILNSKVIHRAPLNLRFIIKSSREKVLKWWAR